MSTRILTIALVTLSLSMALPARAEGSKEGMCLGHKVSFIHTLFRVEVSMRVRKDDPTLDDFKAILREEAVKVRACDPNADAFLRYWVSSAPSWTDRVFKLVGGFLH